MDFSVLADRKAPWHGYQGYVGTDNYRSPEHMTRGAVPGLASDIFTCGLILYELLVGVHPYWQEDQAEYAKRVRAYDAKPPALLGVMPPPADNAEVSAMLHRCLSPDPDGEADGGGDSRGAQRPRRRGPSRAGVVAALRRHRARPAAGGARAARPQRSPAPRGGRGSDVDVEQDSARDAQRGRRCRSACAPRSARHLAAAVRRRRRVLGRPAVHRRAAAGRAVDRHAGARHRERDAVNGAPLTTPRPLSDGDVLAAGRSAKGISKLPLTARAG